jgi:putative Ca2+/H+ antiporter (TMEM165/GDT1 family)
MVEQTRPAASIRWQSVGPVAVLIFLSPVLAELLMGVVHLSNLWLLVPEMSVYGTAALLIREVARRRRRGWGTLLVLGIAFAIAEECMILQTSLTPQFFPPAFDANFGWAHGVQWIYLTAMLWYESMYAIVLPIYLTEMLFPAQRDERWLSENGLAITAGVFVLASIGAWQLWSRVGLQRYGPSAYQVPPLYIVAALAVIAFLVAGILLIKPNARFARKADRRAPRPWLVWLLSFGFSLVWFFLIILAYLPAASLNGMPPFIPIGVGLAWIGIGLLVVRRISAAADWGDRQRLALIFGASVASMLGGTLVVLADAPIDILSKFVFDLIAIVLFVRFAARLQRRELQSET